MRIRMGTLMMMIMAMTLPMARGTDAGATTVADEHQRVLEDIDDTGVVDDGDHDGDGEGPQLLNRESSRDSRGSMLLNWLLEDAEIGLPALSFSLPLLAGQRINCTIKLRCAGIHLGPMKMTVHDEGSAYEVGFQIADLSHTCSGDLWIDPSPHSDGDPASTTLDGIGARHRLGIKVFTPTSALTARWKFDWRDARHNPEQRRGHLPSSISVKTCKARVHYTDESFRLINDDMHVITLLDQEVLNALAPWFGPLVMDPLLCLAVRSVTLTTSVWTNLLRLNMDWFIREELPRRPDSIARLESSVQPRTAQFGPQDTVVRTNTSLTTLVAAFSENFLSSRTPTGEVLVNEAIREVLLEGGPGSRMVLAQNASLPLGETVLFNVKLGLELRNLWIQGLDSVLELLLLEPAGAYTVRNKLRLSEKVVANATFKVKESYSGSAEHVELDENFSVQIEFDPLDLEFVVLAALDRIAVENLTIGSIADAPISCLLGAFANLSLAELRVGADFALPTLRISGEDDLFRVSDAAIQIGSQVIASPLWALVQTHGDAVAQTLSRYALEPLLPGLLCPRRPWPPPSHPRHLVDWEASTVVKALSWLVEDFVGVSGALDLQSVLQWGLAYAFGGRWNATSDLLDLGDTEIALGPFNLRGLFPSLPPPATAELGVQKIKMRGITHVTDILLHADEKRTSDMIASVMTNASEIEMEVSWRIRGVAASGKAIDDHVAVRIAADVAGALVEPRLGVDAASVDAFQLKRLASTCASLVVPAPAGAGKPSRARRSLFASFPAPIGLDDINITLANLGLSARCVRCSSPQLEAALAFMSDNVSQAVLDDFLEDALPALAGFLTNTSSFALLRGANVNFATNNLLAFLQKSCTRGRVWPIETTALRSGDDGDDDDDLPSHSFVKPWWLPPIKAMMIATASLMLAGFAFAVFLARRKSSVLRENQSERIATTLLRTDFLNTGGSSASATRGATPLSFGASQDDRGSQEDAADLDALGATPLLDAEDVIRDRIRRSGGTADSRLSEAGTPKSVFHRELVQDFRRQVSTCESSRNSLLQSPREVVSESDRLYLLGHDRPMITHPSIGRFTGVFIAGILSANFALFVSGNFFTMGRVTIFANFAGDSFREVPMIVLTLDYCIDLLAEGQAFLFFLFIGFCSGVLPWMRVAMLAYAWVAPANVLTVEHRGYLLRAMESIGKWIMAIIYVFMIMTASMNTTVTAPAKYMPFVEGDVVVAYIESIPMWGFTSFLVSAALSTILNHVILFHHDRIVMHNLRAVQVKQTQRLEASGAGATLSALSRRGFETLHAVPDYPMDEMLEEAALEQALLREGGTASSDSLLPPESLFAGQAPGEDGGDGMSEGSNALDVDGLDFSLNGSAASPSPTALWVRRLVRVLVGVAVLMWPVAFVLTFSEPVYEFEFMGVAGIGADLFGVDEASGKVRRMSLASLLVALPNADPAGQSSLFAKLLLFVVYVVLIVIAPALGILAALTMWFVPMSTWLKHRLLMLFRIFNAWNSTNVICATLLVMSLEVYKFFDVVAAGLSFCPPVAGRLLYEVGVPASESVCFGVNSRLDEGWYILLGFVVYSYFLTRAVFYYIADDMNHDFDRCTVFLM